jgi:hypothetical protein
VVVVSHSRWYRWYACGNLSHGNFQHSLLCGLKVKLHGHWLKDDSTPSPACAGSHSGRLTQMQA